MIARPDQVVELPPGVSYEAAACLPVAAVTPWMAMAEHRKIGPGSKVLVLGASGGVGLFAVQIARMLGASAVGVCSARNVALVERLGARAIDDGAGDALEAAAEHGPYDLVLHAVGTATYPLGKCRSLLAPGGQVELVVIRPIDYLAVAFLPSVRTILGAPSRARLAPLVEGLARGDIEPIIEARFPLRDAEKAHERSRRGKVVGKLSCSLDGFRVGMPELARAPGRRAPSGSLVVAQRVAHELALMQQRPGDAGQTRWDSAPEHRFRQGNEILMILWRWRRPPEQPLWVADSGEARPASPIIHGVASSGPQENTQ